MPRSVRSAQAPAIALSGALLVATGAEASAPPAAANGVIAFSSGGTVDTIAADGTGLRTLRAGVRDPALAPGGRLVALAGAGGIEVAAADGSRVRHVTKAFRPCGDGPPAWSPSGRYLAFTRLLPGNRYTDLFWLDLRTGAVKRLTRSSGIAESHPSSSPEGTTIVFAQARMTIRFAPFSLHSIRPDGTHARTVVASSPLQPAWSPDGTTIAYSSSVGGKRTSG